MPASINMEPVSHDSAANGSAPAAMNGAATVVAAAAAAAATENGNGASPAPTKTKICVYCGASKGNKPAHMEAARDLARVMHENDIELVYGGGTVGLMGEVAKTLVSLSGPDAVHGIIPEALVKYERDSTYQTFSSGDGLHVPSQEVYGRTTVVKDMHTRKQLMAQEVFQGGPGSGFIALSGGYGTIEEVLETATWNQLGIHTRGICLLNIDGFYDGILAWIRRSADEGFIHGANSEIVAAAPDAAGAVAALRDYKVSKSTLKLEWGKQ